MNTEEFNKYLLLTPASGVVDVHDGVCFDNEGMVIPTSATEIFKTAFIDKKTKADKEIQVREEMDAILAGISTSETMALMFKYVEAKISAATDSSDAPISTTVLTPTGEDVVVWGDRITAELTDKLVELRQI